MKYAVAMLGESSLNFNPVLAHLINCPAGNCLWTDGDDLKYSEADSHERTDNSEISKPISAHFSKLSSESLEFKISKDLLKFSTTGLGSC